MQSRQGFLYSNFLDGVFGANGFRLDVSMVDNISADVGISGRLTANNSSFFAITDDMSILRFRRHYCRTRILKSYVVRSFFSA